MTHMSRSTVASELRERIVSGIHVGRLRGGERLPAVRTLAKDFGVNDRVVMAAIRELADEGFVELKQRSGAYVVPPHPASGASLPHLGAWLVSMLVQARSRGLAPHDVSEFVRRSMETRRLRAACIECNKDQMVLLCDELDRELGYITDSTPLDTLSAADPPLGVRRADLLVTTAFHADRVRRVAQALGKPWIAVALRPDVMRDIGRQLQQGPVFYVATDLRFERKLRRMLGAVGPVTNLRVFIIGRDDLAEIPSDAPTFVMPSALEFVKRRFRGARGPGRPIHPARHLSDESARELLAFLVQANMAALAAS